MSGRLIGVGVGPGDPELVTLKALRALREADVVAYFAKAGHASHARAIVEFGTSFGISALHLAAALRDNGGGRLITTEFEPSKAVRARVNVFDIDAGIRKKKKRGAARLPVFF